MMATVPHVISGLGLRKFQADGFLLTRVYFGTYVYVHSYHTMLHHIQEDSNTHTNCFENLKSHILIGLILILSLFPLLISIQISNALTKQPCQVYGSIHK